MRIYGKVILILQLEMKLPLKQLIFLP